MAKKRKPSRKAVLSRLGITPAHSMAQIAKMLGLGAKNARKLVVKPPTAKQLAHRERFKRMVASGEMARLREAKKAGRAVPPLLRLPAMEANAMEEAVVERRGRKRGAEDEPETRGGLLGPIRKAIRRTTNTSGLDAFMHLPVGGGGV